MFPKNKMLHSIFLRTFLFFVAALVQLAAKNLVASQHVNRDFLGAHKNGENSTSMDLTVNHPSPLIIASIHQGYGTHFIHLHCGTPPQKQTLIIDTGSDVTGFVCKGCRNCGSQHNVFDPDQSSTYQKLTCSDCLRGKCTKKLRNNPGHCYMEASYREGSGWKANEVMDVCHVGEWYKNPSGKHIQNNVQLSQTVSSALNRFPLKFACQASVSGAFQTQLEDGIIGLEYSKASLWQQMYNFGAIQRQAFALCFGRSLTHSSLAGIFTVGGVDPQFHNSPMVYAKATGIKSEYFSVTVRKVYLREGGGGNSALSKNPNTRTFLLDISEEDLNYEEVIIDSGATDTYFTKKLEKPFQQVWTQITGRKFDKSYTPTLTKEQVDSFPTMIFQLHGVKEYNRQHTKRHIGTIVGLAANLDPGHPFDVLVAVPPSHYLEYSAKKDRFVSRFHFDPNYDSAFGSSTLIGHNVYVDIDNNRIGWAESSCDYAALVGKFPTDKAAANGGSDDREDFGSDNSKPDDVDKGQSEGDDDNSKSVGVDAKEDSLSDEDANDDDDGILHHNTRTDDHNDIDKADKNEKEERQPSLVTTDDLSHVFLSTSRFSNRTQGTVGDPTLVTSVVRTLSTFWYRRFAVSLLLFFVVLLTCGVLQWLRRKRCRGSRCFSRATTPPSSPRSPSLEDVSPSRTTLRLGKVTRRNRG